MILALEIAQSDRDRAHGVVLKRDQRPDVVVPDVERVQDGDHAEHRLGQRQRDVPVHLEDVRPVHICGIEQVVGDGGEEAAEEVDREDLPTSDVGEDQRPVGVEQAELLDPHEGRHQREDARHHEEADHGVEEDGPPWKSIAGKSESRKRGEQQDPRHRGPHHDHRVNEVFLQLPERDRVVLEVERQGRRPEKVAHLASGLYRRDQHEIERQKGEEGDDDQKEIGPQIRAPRGRRSFPNDTRAHIHLRSP